jgi:hypothetical protein
MVKLNELRAGDIVRINDEGLDREGTVVEISHDDHEVLIDNGVQEFWFDPKDIFGVPVDDQQLANLGFEKQDLNGEGAKYLKGAFRIVTPKNGDFSNLEMWYREDRRHFHTPLAVHQLQNLHLQMTKVPLEKPV